MAGPVFKRDFDPAYGTAVEIVPGIRRLTIENPGPYTFRGTNCYLVGDGEITVVDPGPADPAATEAIIAAAGGRISHILVTHTHRDHSPGVAALKARTGAIVIGPEPHRFTRPLHDGETTSLDASGDFDFRADIVAGGGQAIATPAGIFRALATPGHTANHLCFAIDGGDHLISGDHVMAWSTSIVAPPDGSMADYVASLDHLLTASQQVYLPGHGPVVDDGPDFVAGLKQHRAAREAAVLAAIEGGSALVPEIVSAVYLGLDPKLFGAAGLSVFAQIEWLVARGLVRTEGAPSLSGRYEPA